MANSKRTAVLSLVTVAGLVGAVSLAACAEDPSAGELTIAPLDGGASALVESPTGDPNSTSPDEPLQPLTTGELSTYCAKLTQKDYLTRCCSAEDKARPSYATALKNADAAPLFCQVLFGNGVTDGRIGVRPKRRDACFRELDAFEKRACGAATFSDACAGLFQGLQTEGEPCVQDRECASGLLCRGYVFDLNDPKKSEDGVCVPPPKPGEACGPRRTDGGVTVSMGKGCEDGSRCGTSGVCVAGAGEGAPCSPNGCGANLVCVGGTCETSKVAENGACFHDDDCEDSLHCEITSAEFGAAGICKAKQAAGGVCRFDGDCFGECDTTKKACITFCGSR